MWGVKYYRGPVHKRHNVHTGASSSDIIFTTASNSFHLETTTIAGTDAGKNFPHPPARVREQQQGHKAYYTMRGGPTIPPRSSHGWQEYIGNRRGGFSSIALGFPPTCTSTWDPLRSSLS